MAPTRELIPHLYLHVPFCRRLGPYGDQAVTPGEVPDPGVWLQAVGSELRLRRDAGEAPSEPLETLLVGGGAPSTLGPGLMSGIRELLGAPAVEGIGEWSAEADPEDVTPELLDGWRRGGLTRLNLGVHTFHGPALEWLGRGHDPSAGEAAVSAAARSGLPTWGVDLLFGLPPEAGQDPLADVERAGALDIPHISLYELTGEVREGPRSDPDARADTYLLLVDRLESLGYEAYEMTSFARPGHASLHGLALWRGRPYLGLGPGAHSHPSRDRRSWNLREWDAYASSVRTGTLPREGEETLTPDQARLERLWSGLRLREGLPRSRLAPGGVEAEKLLDRWIHAGWARQDPDRVALTPRGWLLLDDLVTALSLVLDR